MDKPESGKVYRLIGMPDEPSVANGNTWAESVVYCDHCNGYGSSLKESADRCTKCGGTGLVR